MAAEPQLDPKFPPPGERPNPSLWRNGAFVRVWSAATVSIFGSLVSRVAIPFVAIINLHADSVGVALVRGMELAAGLAVGLVAGAWVDRLRRRPVMIWADLGRAPAFRSWPGWAAGCLAAAARGDLLPPSCDVLDAAKRLPVTIVPGRSRACQRSPGLWLRIEFAACPAGLWFSCTADRDPRRRVSLSGRQCSGHDPPGAPPGKADRERCCAIAIGLRLLGATDPARDHPGVDGHGHDVGRSAPRGTCSRSASLVSTPRDRARGPPVA
jgi:hypothetical protein